MFQSLTETYEVISIVHLISFCVKHSNLDEIKAIADDIIDENKWTVDGESFATLISCEMFLVGMVKWAKRTTHSIMWQNIVAGLELELKKQFKNGLPLVDIGGAI